MRLFEIKNVEDCFDGSSVFQYWFEDRWTEDEILSLSILGKVEYFPEFPRPFFRVTGETGLQLKGVEGENNCRVILPATGKEVLRKKVFEFLKGKENLNGSGQ